MMCQAYLQWITQIDDVFLNKKKTREWVFCAIRPQQFVICEKSSPNLKYLHTLHRDKYISTTPSRTKQETYPLILLIDTKFFGNIYGYLHLCMSKQMATPCDLSITHRNPCEILWGEKKQEPNHHEQITNVCLCFI